MNFEPNKYQQAIFDHVINNKGHLVVEANAGTGKTATNVEIIKLLPPTKSILGLAFNKHIEVELSSKVPPHATIKTMHSLGLGTITKFIRKFPKIDDNKLKNIFLRAVKNQNVPEEYIRELMGVVLNITEMFRATLLPPTCDNMEDIMDKYSITTSCDLHTVLSLVQEVLTEDVKQLGIVDFGDMIYLPVRLNMPFNKYDYVLVDESQDLNPSQIRMLLMVVKPKTGTIIAVGDRYQSLYGFRGADIDAIPNIIEALNPTVLPLSVCYRCPTSHIELAQQFVPSIEAAPNASTGEIHHIDTDDMIETVTPGDLCICRYNAPLIRPAFTLLKEGIKVTIKGHDIGKGLITLINKTNASTLEELEDRLEVWKDNEVARLERRNKSIDSVMDKYECIMCFISEVSSIAELKKHIKNIFSEDNGEITFSSIHRAKGLESTNVYIINPENMPSKYASKDWEHQQERNCQYVAYTRSKQNLYMVSG